VEKERCKLGSHSFRSGTHEESGEISLAVNAPLSGLTKRMHLFKGHKLGQCVTRAHFNARCISAFVCLVFRLWDLIHVTGRASIAGGLGMNTRKVNKQGKILQ